MAGRENHTLALAVTDPQHIHEEIDHAYATFHPQRLPVRPPPAV